MSRLSRSPGERPDPPTAAASPSDTVTTGSGYSRTVIRSFLWQGGGNFLGQAVSWAATLVVIRLLAPEDYGLMAMANVFFGLFMLVSNLGFGSAAIQAQELSREQLQRVFGVVLVLNTLAAAVIVAVAPLVAAYFSEPRLIPLIRVLSLNFLLIAVYLLPQAGLVREMDFGTKARVDFGATIGSAMVTLLLALLGFGVWALVLGLMALYTLKAILYNVVRWDPLIPDFSFRSVAGLARFGMLTTLSTILFFAYGQADVIIGGRFLGTEAIGLYAVALQLASIPMEKVLPVITQVSFAAFSRIQDDRARVTRNLLRSIRLVSLLCFPAFLGLASVAPDFVPIVLGERWIELVLPFQIICLVLPLKAVASLFAPPIFGIGRPGINAWSMFIALVVMSIALLVGAQYGLMGLVLAWVFGYPVVFIATALLSLRTLEIPLMELVRSMGPPTLTSLVMFAGVLWLGSLLPGFSPLARLASMVLAGVLLYTLATVAFNRRSVAELASLVRG